MELDSQKGGREGRRDGRREERKEGGHISLSHSSFLESCDLPLGFFPPGLVSFHTASDSLNLTPQVSTGFQPGFIVIPAYMMTSDYNINSPDLLTR